MIDRYELVAAVVTLDGKPAKISGVLRPFATVAQLPFGTVAEFSWKAAARIVAAGGAFKAAPLPTPVKKDRAKKEAIAPRRAKVRAAPKEETSDVE